MGICWYIVGTFMLAMYVVLDGFDFWVGALHPFVARTEAERREALASIGPVWNGNEVWLIARGGRLFFAFPKAYAAGFSGFYPALILVLWLLIFRGLAPNRLTADWFSYWISKLAGLIRVTTIGWAFSRLCGSYDCVAILGSPAMPSVLSTYRGGPSMALAGG
ncbi:MAG: cytochrome d ubiquinol oxidase subunit II [Nitrospirae bacterium]|nr:cytochrome d ubiquinol oxidase subunit II [Nitrospirota bacterium]